MKFAVLADWPDVKNAEYEVIERIVIAANNINHHCVVVDAQGWVLEKHLNKYNQTKNRICEFNDILFLINIHFTSPKLCDVYTYVTMWNPPQFFIDWGYSSACGNFLSADDFLIYTSKPMLSHLSNLLLKSRRTIKGAMNLVPSIPYLEGECNLQTSDLYLFYSGINWERLGNKKGRHHDLFHLLDKEKVVRFFGPDVFFGQRPWAGFDCYKGEIPFDGFSTINEIRKCGVSLVISSDIHRENSAATNRLYESLEAGAIIISDNNPFVVENFTDCILIVEYSENYKDTFDQIIAHFNWIKNNLSDALIMAKKAQKKYRMTFSLEMQLETIINNHPIRKKQVRKNSNEINAGNKLTVIIDALKGIKHYNLKSTLDSLYKQQLKKFKIIIVSSLNDYKHFIDNKDSIIYLDNECFSISHLSIDSLNIHSYKKGQIVEYISLRIDLELCIVINQGDYLFTNHLSSLIYPIINENKIVTISGWLRENKEGYRELESYGRSVSLNDILDGHYIAKSASVMFTVTDNISLWNLNEMLSSYFIADANLEDKIGYSHSATVIISSDHKEKIILESEFNFLRDCFLYDERVSSKLSGIPSKSLNMTDEMFIRIQKRILWKYFAKFPKFQRLAQRIYKQIKGLIK